MALPLPHSILTYPGNEEGEVANIKCKTGKINQRGDKLLKFSPREKLYVKRNKSRGNGYNPFIFDC